MAWGTLQIGSLVLKETDILEDVTNANTGVRSVRLEGSETNPGTTSGQTSIEEKQADIMSLMGRTLPVQFERKTSYNGFYTFTDTNTALEKWAQGPGQVRWSLAMELVGVDGAIDFESRLANVLRANDFSLAGERWLAPPRTHYGFQAASTVPPSISRTSTDGAIIVYRSIPAGVNPQWAVPVAGYLSGRVRLLNNGVERIGERIPLATGGWELSNGLIRVKPYVGGLTTSISVAMWDGTAWRSRDWDLRMDGTTLTQATHFQSVTVTRNDPECVSLRIVMKHPTNSTRGIVDLLLRRGSRFVEAYMQQVSASVLSAQLDGAEAWTLSTGYAAATAADANGIRWAAGSAKTFTLATNGGVSKSSATTLDFWIGAEPPTPASGDLAADLAQQYVGAMAEKVGVIKR